MVRALLLLEGVPPSRVRIVHGQAGRRKSLDIEGEPA